MIQKSLSELTDLNGKVAIVTGGSMGIGRGIVERLHEAGASIVVADVADDEGNAFVHELNESREGSAHFVHCDVSKEHDVEDIVHHAVEEFGGLDIMVNNAGIFPFIPLSDLSEDNFMAVIEVNLKGVFLGTKYASEQMKAQGRGGTIVTVASIDALHPSAVGLAAYDASKHGVWGFVKNVALELAPYGIRVNALAPGGVATPGVAKLSPPDADEAFMQAQAAGIPMHRFGDPDEMGRVVLFLASDLSSYMTGSIVVADGGKLLM